MVRMRGGRRRLFLAGAVVASSAVTQVPALAGAETMTTDVPQRRTVDAAVIRTSTADAPVQVNVDIGMQVQAGKRCSSPLPGVCTGGNVYHPCFNLHDPAYAGCQLYTLFRVVSPDQPHELLQGITIGRSSTARDGTVVEHQWAGRVTQADLELYAADVDGRFGDARMRIKGFATEFRGTAYSAQIGHLNLPREGDADVGRLVGRAIGSNGRPMPAKGFKLDTFGHENTIHKTGLLGGRSFDLYGFGGATVRAGTVDGSFASKPLWAGAYDVHIQRKGASFNCGVDITAGAPTALVLDFRNTRNLGNRRCVPMRSLAQGVPG